MKTNRKTWACCCVFFVVLTSSSWCNAASDEMYQSGKAAFEKNDYLSASKFLFAYLQAAHSDLSQNMVQTVNSALNYSDEQIRLAISTKQQLDKYGKVVEVTVESSGKADEMGKHNKTVRISVPQTHTPKPGLPQQSEKVPGKNPRALPVPSRTVKAMPLPQTPVDARTPNGDFETLRKKYEKIEQNNAQLTAENERLRARMFENLQERYAELKRNNERLAAENERLKAVIREQKKTQEKDNR